MVLVPLDYYRILGLPIQATAEQLQQAHRDRSRQLPRREYSDVAIDSRKQLIDEAYAVLSDAEERQIYDGSFLAKAYEIDSVQSAESQQSVSRLESSTTELDPHIPSIEIEPEQLVGALLILQELGEYELVLKLALPYLGANNISLKQGRFGDPQLIVPDIVLTVALACLELGREQWQQGQYQKTATSLETGQELLLREELFPNVRGEIQADLYKLRPYRVLELLALPESKVKERRHGLQLLRDMLEERQGIDGNGDDRSGLTVDDFLRFIQQLRSHLTAAEQQELFEAEARRPSAVATYLAVYALVARGFADRQPSLIRRAKLMLTHLGRRQDVHLEQAVCALLLGQTEEASQALELTQEHELLEFIRENSQDSPDLLPGLCLYGERWIQSEVFPYFRDLVQAEASLKDYFADPECQAYLESLPDSSAEEANQWMVVPPPKSPITVGLPQPASYREPALTMPSLAERLAQSQGASNGSASDYHSVESTDTSSKSPRSLPPMGASSSTKSTISSLPPNLSASSNSQSMSQPVDTTAIGQSSRASRSRLEDKSRLPVASRVHSSSSSDRVETNSAVSPRSSGKSSNKKGAGLIVKGLKIERLILVAGVGLVAIWLFWNLFKAIFFSGPTLKGEQLQISLNQPLVAIPEIPQTNPSVNNGQLNTQEASQVIQQWFALKSQALGPEHQFEQLDTVLVDPALTRWRETAQLAQTQNWYWEYQHQLDIKEIMVDQTDPNQASVEVDVTEVGKLYEAGQFTRDKNEQLRVRYELVRAENGQWRLRNWDILQ